MSKSKMVGGAYNDGVVKTGNIFAALDNRRKKSGKSKDKAKAEKSKKLSNVKPSEKQPAQFWAPAPIKAKSWADVDEDDDDDYYATTAPPPSVWGKVAVPVKESASHAEESDADDDVMDEVEDEVEEEEEQEPTHTASQELPSKNSVLPPPVVPKESEKQLSKKELKKKELAELEKVLEEFGIPTESKQSNGISFLRSQCTGACTNKEGRAGNSKEDANGQEDKHPVSVAESKGSKRRKPKKDKSSKEPKDVAEHGENSGTQSNNRENGMQDVSDAAKKDNDGDTNNANSPTVDRKEVLKKLAASKQKKKNKESDAAAKVAAEAAVRAAKLATAKKKEKSHYNQQPAR